MLSSSDWLTIISSMLGMGIAAAISWIFFRAQQKTDYVKIRESLTSLESKNILINEILIEQRTSTEKMINNIYSIKNSTSMNDKIDLFKELSDIKNQVNGLGSNVISLVDKITSDIKIQQSELLELVQQKFYQQVSMAQKTLVKDIERELLNAGKEPVDESEKLQRIVELIGHVLNSMGEFQRATIKNQSEIILSNVQSDIVGRVNEVSREVNDIKRKMDQLPAPIN